MLSFLTSGNNIAITYDASLAAKIHRTTHIADGEIVDETRQPVAGD